MASGKGLVRIGGLGLGPRAFGSEFRVHSLGFGVWGSGFGVWSLGIRV
jgi:hypothetical protein